MTTESHSRTKLTYADYRLFPADGRRHEIIDGDHYVNPAPGTYHQLVSGRLYVQLSNAIASPGLGEVYPTPIDVQLSEHDVVQPDLVVVLEARRTIVTPTKIKGAPDLVVEILSPSTAETDRTQKLHLYERAGVPEYWIVDPEEHVVEQYVLREGAYALAGSQDRDLVWLGLPDVRIDLTTVW
jgi:Uma2 family endonuclease